MPLIGRAIRKRIPRRRSVRMHPCPTCGGKGKVQLGRGKATTPCTTCHGHRCLPDPRDLR